MAVWLLIRLCSVVLTRLLVGATRINFISKCACCRGVACAVRGDGDVPLRLAGVLGMPTQRPKEGGRRARVGACWRRRWREEWIRKRSGGCRASRRPSPCSIAPWLRSVARDALFRLRARGALLHSRGDVCARCTTTVMVSLRACAGAVVRRGAPWRRGDRTAHACHVAAFARLA